MFSVVVGKNGKIMSFFGRCQPGRLRQPQNGFLGFHNSHLHRRMSLQETRSEQSVV